MLMDDHAKAQQSVTMLLTLSAEAGAAMRRAAEEGGHLAAPPRRAPLNELECALLNLSIEPLYRESEDGAGQGAEVSRRFLASLIGRPARYPFELRDLRGLDARLMQHAACVLRLGRGIDGAAYIRQCNKETITDATMSLKRETS